MFNLYIWKENPCVNEKEGTKNCDSHFNWLTFSEKKIFVKDRHHNSVDQAYTQWSSIW